MKVFEIDAEELTPREINSQVKEAAAQYDKIIIRNPNAKHYLVAGVTEDVEIELDGSVGYFGGCMCDGPKIKINGNAGWFVGDNITGGEVIVEGTAGDGAGQGIYDGTVVVRESVGSRTGEIMKNGTIIIGGNSGFMTGIFMMGGRIIILGDVGDDVAESIIRGVIYVMGDIKSLGYNAKLDELTFEDSLELEEVLSKYDFDVDDISQFKKIVPESTRPFYGH